MSNRNTNFLIIIFLLIASSSYAQNIDIQEEQRKKIAELNQRIERLESKLKSAQNGEDNYQQEEQKEKIIELSKRIERLESNLKSAQNERDKYRKERDKLQQEKDSCFQLAKTVGTKSEQAAELIHVIFVQGGAFTMGCTSEQGDDCQNAEKPSHQVNLNDYYIGKYEVTVGQFRAFIEATGYKTEAEKGDGAYIWANSEWKKKSDVNWQNPNFTQIDNCPVTCVSWNDANAYCQWLNQKTGKKYRLPTEAEWEYAARGGNKSKGYKYSGSNNINDVAWYHGNSPYKTQPVGTKQANELGIYDMSGNVAEWCSDWYGSYSSNSQNNPVGASSGSQYVYRNGGWGYSATECRVTYRNAGSPDYRDNYKGFRVVYILE